MRPTMFGGEATMKLSSWSFRVTGTLLVLMLPLFLIGNLTPLRAASAALGALAIGAGVAVIVGSIAAIWDK